MTSTKTPRAVGSWIKKLRKKQRLTQTKFAKKIGCAPSLISHYETGRVLWPTNRIWQLIVDKGL
tara:strand:- start:36499 stop:36690 length:192 start_codon:yes stop_codon:yes gene_type:complete